MSAIPIFSGILSARTSLRAESAFIVCLLITACYRPESKESPTPTIASEPINQTAVDVRRECTYFVGTIPIWQAENNKYEPMFCQIRTRVFTSQDSPAKKTTEQVITFPDVYGAIRVQGPMDSGQPERWVINWSRATGEVYEVIEREGDCFILSPDRLRKLCFGRELANEDSQAASLAPPPIAPAIAEPQVAGPSTPDEAPDRLIQQWYGEENTCRGSSTPDDRDTMAACQRRSALGSRLAVLGYCYGRAGEAEYQSSWHVCGPDSERAAPR